MCMAWIESHLWGDKYGNYLLLLSQTGWAMGSLFRTSLPRSGMDAFEKQPTAAFHWLTGKTFRDVLESDVLGAVRILRYFAGWTNKQRGEVHDLGDGQLGLVHWEPYPVIGAILAASDPL